MTSENVKPCIKCGGTELYADGRCAACRRESARKYYAANPEKERERDRKRHAADPAKRRESTRKWRAANPEKVRESSRKRREANPGVGSENAKKWRVANPERARESMRVANRKRNTGWTPEHESHAWEVQGGKCGLCGISLPSMQKATADHDHENGFARALLCKKCNLAEGMVKKSPEIVAQLEEYREFYRRHPRWIRGVDGLLVLPSLSTPETQSERERSRRSHWSRERVAFAWEHQGGRCGLCRKELESKEKAHADHEHSEAKTPRELLCRRCNVLEGFATPEFVERLDRYWAHYRRDHTLLADRILLLAS